MKRAVILVGGHHVGKSLTLNNHLKPLLNIKHDAHIFTLGGRSGYILSQSAEEAERDMVAAMEKYGHYDILVLAARPYSDPVTKLKLLWSMLQKEKYVVSEVAIHSEEEAPKKAKEILSMLI